VSLGGERPEHGALLERVAEHHRLGGGDEAAEELVVDGPLYEQAAAGQAHLPGVGEDGPDRPRHGGLEVGVGEDQVGALAAELEAHRGEVGRGGARDRPPCRRLPGEHDAVDRG
jgi:hypothetical protein